MLKIFVRDVTTAGIDIDQAVSVKDIGLEPGDADVRSPLRVKAHLEKVDNTIIADTQLNAEFGYVCARCLEEFSSPQERAYKFNFEIDPESETIDLGEEIRQEIILSDPPRVLCSEDCKGICPKCGANLNIEPCKCS